ncbi:MAG TPA: UbiA-like polyprenyltransferase, partial [Planctomycetota bacterium]|nr:UbiA-like polyprenyltransferase [Planctomycetota bacterium]
MLGRIRTTLEMIKVQHSLFALPWAFVGAFYAAGGLPPWGKLGWILLAMIAARCAAMAFNRAVDAGIDAENPRTRLRAIPAGKLSVGFTLAFAAVMVGLLLLAAAMLNPLCLKLSPVALLVTLGYSFTKRFTALCHFVLGLSLAAAPIGAWLAISPERAGAPLPYLLGVAVMFWIAGADILYACEDFEFDRSKRLHSIPAAVGIRTALVVSILCHVVVIGALVAVGISARLGLYFFGAIAAIAVLLVYEHAIVKPDDLRRVNQAFFHVNAVVSGVILAGS